MHINEKLQDISMMIIANSGASRSSVFDALESAKQGDFDKADEFLAKAKEFFLLAHNAHRDLLQMNALGEVEQLDVFLTHAQDHLMNSMLAEELIREIIVLYKKFQYEGGK
jgi:cellobiose PTS system EIIA component